MTVPYCGLEGVSLCERVPTQSACAPCLWWRAGYDTNGSYALPCDVLALVTLVGGVAGYGGTRAVARC